MRLVYFVQAASGGPIKIGVTSDLALRMVKMRTDSPLPLNVLGVSTMLDEKELHAHFAAARAHGEWFHPVPELMSMLAGLAAVAVPASPRRVRRQFRGVDIVELAMATGIHRSLLDRYARGEVGVGAKNARALATALGISIESLIYDERAGG